MRTLIQRRVIGSCSATVRGCELRNDPTELFEGYLHVIGLGSVVLPLVLGHAHNRAKVRDAQLGIREVIVRYRHVRQG